MEWVWYALEGIGVVFVLPFLDFLKNRIQLKTYSVFHANNPYMVVASLHFVFANRCPCTGLEEGQWRMQTPQRGGAAESIDSLLHRCDESPERGETTRCEETNPEVAAPDGDAGGGGNEVSDGDECVEDDDIEGSMIDLPDPVEEMSFPPDLCQYTAKAGALQQLTDNIRGQQQLKRGIRVSYPTT